MTSHDIDETDGAPRAYEYEPGGEDDARIGGRLLLAALGWGFAGWCLVAGAWHAAKAIVGWLA